MQWAVADQAPAEPAEVGEDLVQILSGQERLEQELGAGFIASDPASVREVGKRTSNVSNPVIVVIRLAP